MSRNFDLSIVFPAISVTSREGRVSRNLGAGLLVAGAAGHVPRGTCE